MFDKCKDCENDKLLKQDIQDHDAVMTFYKWETPNKHVTKVRITLPIDAAITTFRATVISLKKHIYTKRTTIQTQYQELL